MDMPEDKVMALTFDDGPCDETSEILDCLEEHRATATFFVIGRNIEGRERILRRAAGLGCELGNHGFTHTPLTDLDDAAIEDELRTCSDAIEAAVGKRPTLLRPPKGNYQPNVVTIAGHLGLTTVLSTMHTRDWTGNPPEEIVEAVMAGKRPGCVVVSHDGSHDNSRRTNTVSAMREIIPMLLKDGYQLATYSELLEKSPEARKTLAEERLRELATRSSAVR